MEDEKKEGNTKHSSFESSDKKLSNFRGKVADKGGEGEGGKRRTKRE